MRPAGPAAAALDPLAGGAQHGVDDGRVQPAGAHLVPSAVVASAAASAGRCGRGSRLVWYASRGGEDPAGQAERRPRGRPGSRSRRGARATCPAIRPAAPAPATGAASARCTAGRAGLAPTPPAVSGPALSQIAFDTPSRPKPGDEPGPAEQLLLRGRQAEARRPRPRPGSRPPLECPSGEGRLEVDEPADRGQRLVALGLGQRAGRGPARRRSPRPRSRARRARGTPSRRRRSTTPTSVGSNCVPDRRRRQRRARLDAVVAVSDLQELGQLRDAGRHRDRARPTRLAGVALAVPALVGAAQSVEHVGGEAELLAQRPGELRRGPSIIPSSSLRPDTAKSMPTRIRCSGVPPQPSSRSIGEQVARR